MKNSIDLRSDTVTQPCRGMREAISQAVVGDDVFGDDPTVNKLEALTAEILGKEAALLCPSGTQSNLVALLSHCERGDEYIVGSQAHTYKYEGGGAAVLGSIQPQPIDYECDGSLDLDKVRAAIKIDDYHFARTRLLTLENTTGGKVICQKYIHRAHTLVQETGLGFHLDGARMANAAVAQGRTLADLAAPFDTISLCLSKGLGAPAGSMLCGHSELIAKARRWRKVTGGGMRQSGLLAAAGIFVLKNNIERLAEDHDHARQLAEGLKDVATSQIEKIDQHTNMVFVHHRDLDLDALSAHMESNGIRIMKGSPLRLVLHKDINHLGVNHTIIQFQRFFDGKQ